MTEYDLIAEARAVLRSGAADWELLMWVRNNLPALLDGWETAAIEVPAAHRRIAELEAAVDLRRRALETEKREHDRTCEDMGRLRRLAHKKADRLNRVTRLFDLWAAEENEHRTAGEFGMAEVLHVAIEDLREAVYGSQEVPDADRTRPDHRVPCPPGRPGGEPCH